MRSTFRQKWRRRNMLMFFERLNLYISSGLSLDNAILLISQGAPKKHIQVFERIHTSVVSGSRLSFVLQEAVLISPTITSMLQQGESSGNLSSALSRIQSLIEREDDLIKKSISATIYPAVIGIFAVSLTLVLMRGIMPQIVPMLKSLHTDLPLLTKLVIAVSDFLIRYGFTLFIIITFALWSVVFLVKRSTLVRYAFQSCLITVPIVGRIIYSYYLCLFFESFACLIASGMSLPETFKNTYSTIRFIPLKKSMDVHISDISNGITFASIVARIPRIPYYISSLIRAGEMSGSLAISISRSASILNKDIEESLKKLTSLLEPIMMAGIGTVVGAIAVSIMMPIYDVSKVLQH